MNSLTFVAAFKLMVSTPDYPAMNIEAYDGSYALNKGLLKLSPIIDRIASLKTKTYEISFAGKIFDFLGHYWREHSCAPSLQVCMDHSFGSTYQSALHLEIPKSEQAFLFSQEETEHGWRTITQLGSMVGPYTPDDILVLLDTLHDQINNYALKHGISVFMQATTSGLLPEALDALQASIQEARTGQALDTWEHSETEEDAYRRYYELWEARKIPLYTGMESIDKVTMGFARSDLVAILGATAHGKSALTAQWAYNALSLGLNGVYISLEMSTDVVSARFHSLHSSHPKFKGMGSPVSANTLVKGTFKDFGKDYQFLFKTVIPDFANLPGKLKVIARPSSQFGWEELERTLMALDQDPELPLNYFIIDHPDCMDKPNKRGAAAFQNTDELYKQIRRITLTHNKGIGITGFLPIQANSSGIAAAEKNDGIYSLTAIATSSEIAKSCTHVFYIASFPEMKENNECLIGCLKDRDGGKIDRFRASVNPVSGAVQEITSPPHISFLGGGMGTFNL